MFVPVLGGEARTDIVKTNHPLAGTYPMAIVNYRDERGLIYTLTGVDFVISFITGTDQLLLIDSSLKAHVSRFIPSEFGISPESRGQHATLDRGQRLAQIRLRDHVAEGMEYTLITCGILYERFGPGGLIDVNMGSLQGPRREGDFLVDVRNRRAQIPLDRNGRPATLCMSSMEDVARAIVAALDLAEWPRALRFRGERCSALDVVRMAERATGNRVPGEANQDADRIYAGTRFERVEYSTDSLRSALALAQSNGRVEEQHGMNLLLATAAGGFDFTQSNFNDFVPQVRPSGLESWLIEAWREAL